MVNGNCISAPSLPQCHDLHPPLVKTQGQGSKSWPLPKILITQKGVPVPEADIQSPEALRKVRRRQKKRLAGPEPPGERWNHLGEGEVGKSHPGQEGQPPSLLSL